MSVCLAHTVADAEKSSGFPEEQQTEHEPQDGVSQDGAGRGSDGKYRRTSSTVMQLEADAGIAVIVYGIS